MSAIFWHFDSLVHYFTLQNSVLESQNAKEALIEYVKMPKIALIECYFFQSYTTVSNTDL